MSCCQRAQPAAASAAEAATLVRWRSAGYAFGGVALREGQLAPFAECEAAGERLVAADAGWRGEEVSERPEKRSVCPVLCPQHRHRAVRYHAEGTDRPPESAAFGGPSRHLWYG